MPKLPKVQRFNFPSFWIHLASFWFYFAPLCLIWLYFASFGFILPHLASFCLIWRRFASFGLVLLQVDSFCFVLLVYASFLFRFAYFCPIIMGRSVSRVSDATGVTSFKFCFALPYCQSWAPKSFAERH